MTTSIEVDWNEPFCFKRHLEAVRGGYSKDLEDEIALKYCGRTDVGYRKIQHYKSRVVYLYNNYGMHLNGTMDRIVNVHPPKPKLNSKRIADLGLF